MMLADPAVTFPRLMTASITLRDRRVLTLLFGFETAGPLTMTKPHVLISAFADEAANYKTALEQFSALAACGLRYYSPRFIDVNGSSPSTDRSAVGHVVDLDEPTLKKLAGFQKEFGFKATSIGARLGKVKLRDVDDGSHNKYVDPQEYLAGEVANTIRAAEVLGAKLVRGFSYYHPQTDRPEGYVEEAANALGPIVDACADSGLVYGLEVEANLIGQNGHLLAELAKKVGRPNLVCIYDGGNLSSQNMTPLQCYEEYVAMKDYLGWIHIKDYEVDPNLEWTGKVDEERLKNFVPCDVGDSGHEMIFRDLAKELPTIEARMQKLGADGVFVELEPHLKGGGQFGGFSGPDGIGVACRALCRLLDYSGISYDLRTLADIRADRGF